VQEKNIEVQEEKYFQSSAIILPLAQWPIPEAHNTMGSTTILAHIITFLWLFLARAFLSKVSHSTQNLLKS